MHENEEILSQDKQDEIAHSCAITVVTEPHLAVRRGLIIRSLQLALPAACAAAVNETRFDLLALPNLDEVVEDGERFGLLVGDVRTALSLHQTEYLAVITEEGIQARLLEKLSGDPDLSGVTMCGFRAPSSRTTPGDVLALTCMDWRLHGCGGFIRQMKLVCDRRLGGVLTIPGAAKDLSGATARGRATLPLLRDLVESGFGKIMLVSHSDCGKYGGHGAFADSGEEFRRLSDDLHRAASFIRADLDVEVGLGIAVVAASRIAGIVEPAAAEKTLDRSI